MWRTPDAADGGDDELQKCAKEGSNNILIVPHSARTLIKRRRRR